MFAAIPTPTYLTYGNVDIPHLYPRLPPDGIHAPRRPGGRDRRLHGGFVGGGLKTPMHTPYEISDEDYAAKVAAVSARS